MEWWPILWLFVALKIPLLAALWIVWWALRAPPAEPDEETIDDEGRGPHAPRPQLPDAPRRGPHATPTPSSPRRVRVRSRGRLATHR